MRSKMIKYWRETLVFLFSFFILFFSFQFNAFSAAKASWFEIHQFDSEALVIGRLVKSRNDGIFSETGRLGRYYGLIGNRDKTQTELYLKERNGGKFGTYNSQLGLQGTFFSLLDQLLERFTSIKLKNRIDFFHATASALQALALAAIILLLYLEIGLIPSFIVLLSTMYSQWLVVFGRNLYWVMGLMFIPMVIVWLSHKIEEAKNIFNLRLIFFFVFVSILLKASTGYEYISTVLIAMLSPVIYFSIKNSWTFKKLMNRILFLGLAGMLGFILSFSLHIFQSSLADKTTIKQAASKQLEHAKLRMDTKKEEFESSSSWARGAIAPRSEILNKYWRGEAFNLQNIMGWEHFKTINFYDLIYLFFIFSALGLMSKQYSNKIANNRKKIIALIAVTWFSILAPLSWYTLAKLHSYVHGHMNHVLWHMPFSIYGFALIGFISYLLWNDLTKQHKYGLISIVILSIIWDYKKIYNDEVKITNMLHKKKLMVINPKKNIKLIITNDNKLVYHISNCKSIDIADRFFLHIYPKNKKTHLSNLDFIWEQYNIQTSLFSKYNNSCIAVRDLPIYPIKSINTGRYKGSRRFWQKNFNISIKSKDIIFPFNLSDNNWENGISKSQAKFFIQNTLENRQSIVNNSTLKFASSGERKVINITYFNQYINIDVNGSKLDPVKDGYPNKIKILKGN